MALWYKRPMSESGQTGLVRAIGRWSLAALMVNSIIGSGVFGLPSVVAGLLGKGSPWAVLLAGAAIGVIMACFAEVASQFSEAGGPYLYVRVAFGRLMGIQTGWMLWLAQIAAPAANANLFVIYLGEFWPHAKDPIPRLIILTLLIGILTLINYRGVRAGARVSDVFTLAKLLPLGIVIVGGAVYLMATHHAAVAAPTVADGERLSRNISPPMRDSMSTYSSFMTNSMLPSSRSSLTICTPMVPPTTPPMRSMAPILRSTFRSRQCA